MCNITLAIILDRPAPTAKKILEETLYTASRISPSSPVTDLQWWIKGWVAFVHTKTLLLALQISVLPMRVRDVPCHLAFRLIPLKEW